MSTARVSIQTLVERLQKDIPVLGSPRCVRALEFAHEVYGDKTFDLMQDQTLFDHALATAEVLTEFCSDEDAIISCILQHTLKVTDASLERIADEFGRSVRDMVSRIHLLSHLHTSDWRRSVDDMKIMLVSISDDVRILLIVLAIECYFMEHLVNVLPEYRSRLCRQTLQLFAPVTARLGIYTIKYRLERAAFPECYPTDAAHIAGQFDELHKESGVFLDDTGREIRSFLATEGIRADIMAREKQPYSVFQKMRTKSVTGLTKISDLFAIRVIVPTVNDCYQVLGLLHRIGTPISHRFKDYISFPKPNGYQSLHTSLIGLPGAPKDIMIEVQIRTSSMHLEAEYGIAAHWLYKEKAKSGVLDSANRLQLSDVLLKQQSVGQKSDNDADHAAMRLVDHIYVLTPRGDIIELPDGGTPLDFAFIVHTDLGLKFKSARVNGSVVPLGHKLENGDVIEILTHKHPRPSLQWLEELSTPSARSKLKAYFFSHNRAQFLQKGRDNVNAELKLRGLPPLDNDFSILNKFDERAQSIKQREDLLVKVGMGSVRTSSVLRHIPLKRTPRRTAVRKTKTVKSAAIKPKDLVAVEGQPLSMPYRFAKCCSPEQGTPRTKQITGIITRTGIISVHRTDCHSAKSANPERRVKMKWN